MPRLGQGTLDFASNDNGFQSHFAWCHPERWIGAVLRFRRSDARVILSGGGRKGG